jgi:hypothetical protein
MFPCAIIWTICDIKLLNCSGGTLPGAPGMAPGTTPGVGVVPVEPPGLAVVVVVVGDAVVVADAEVGDVAVAVSVAPGDGAVVVMGLGLEASMGVPPAVVVGGTDIPGGTTLQG